ncbi:unnamed protein product [Pseudo-nitzschia multistriata]|uniref:OCRE domain-containing protein n=1 Tax=Pseudo-nitzschia multistriata TaxID=183589 RepID=A0A448ZH55_9STRA|nr:unnamed protein product [Pseudo-nitzschia multistriata]
MEEGRQQFPSGDTHGSDVRVPSDGKRPSQHGNNEGGRRIPSYQSDQKDRHEIYRERLGDASGGHGGRREEPSNRGYRTKEPPLRSLSSRRETPSASHQRGNEGGTEERRPRNNDGCHDSRRANPAVNARRSWGGDHRRHYRDHSGDYNHNGGDTNRYDSRRRYDRHGDGEHEHADDRYRRDSVGRGRRTGDGRDQRYGDRYDEFGRRGRGRSIDDDDFCYGDKGDRRKRSDSGYCSDEPFERSRRDGRRTSAGRRDGWERPRSRSRDYKTDGDYDYDRDRDSSDNDNCEETSKKREPKEKEREWPPSFQKDGSAFTFDTRSAMFYEPLSDFFYDPKSKLYYGNKKSAYFRYDVAEDPPFVQVKKMTAEEVEEQHRGDGGGFSQEKLAVSDRASAVVSKPKIAIKLKTKKVKSSKATANTEGSNHQPGAGTVSRAKQEQIANIGKWTEKQAELKQTEPGADTSRTAPPAPRQGEGTDTASPKVRTTAKGEPICLLCKRKFPDLAKLRLHERASELHKKNLQKFREKKKRQQNDASAKRKPEGSEASAAGTNAAPVANETVYTDRAKKRRQLHGVELCASANGLPSLGRTGERKEPPPDLPSPAQAPGSDLFQESNVGKQMLQKLGYKFDSVPPGSNPPQQEQEQQTMVSDASTKPRTTNEHLRKEWDRIEALAAAKSKSRYPSKH